RGDAEGSDFQRYLLSPCHHRILRRRPFASAEEPGRAARGLALLEVCPYPADSALLRHVRWRACRWRPRLGRPSLCAGPLDAAVASAAGERCMHQTGDRRRCAPSSPDLQDHPPFILLLYLASSGITPVSVCTRILPAPSNLG